MGSPLPGQRSGPIVLKVSSSDFDHRIHHPALAPSRAGKAQRASSMTAASTSRQCPVKKRIVSKWLGPLHRSPRA